MSFLPILSAPVGAPLAGALFIFSDSRKGCPYKNSKNVHFPLKFSHTI